MNFFRLLISVIVLSAGMQWAAAAPKQRAKHVVLIGLDGWGAYSVPKAEMPNLAKLMEQGSYTLKKRTVLPSSSAPNWATMFMGAPTEIHGYTTWNSRMPEIPSPVVNEHGIFPTVFSVAREARPKAEIGVFYEWDGIKYLVDTLALSHHTQGAGDKLCTMAEEYIKGKRPELVAICFDEPDHTGHAVGHDTPEYYSVLKHLDTYIGRIVKAIDDAGMTDNTVIIITSDHGGINKNHGGITLMEMETPFVIAGRGIRHNHKITDVMMQYDVASTIAAILGIEQPQAWTGHPAKASFK